MEIRKTTMEDLDAVLALYEQARKFMRENGNPNQWGTSRPGREDVVRDIENGKSYVCVEGGRPVAVFYYTVGVEPDYARFYDGGAWLNDEPYGFVHRIASPAGVRGAASFCLNWCFEQSGGNIRIDTHADNLPMQRLLAKNGFVRCGIIHIANGEERIAYQKTKNSCGNTASNMV